MHLYAKHLALAVLLVIAPVIAQIPIWTSTEGPASSSAVTASESSSTSEIFFTSISDGAACDGDVCSTISASSAPQTSVQGSSSAQTSGGSVSTVESSLSATASGTFATLSSSTGASGSANGATHLDLSTTSPFVALLVSVLAMHTL